MKKVITNLSTAVLVMGQVFLGYSAGGAVESTSLETKKMSEFNLDKMVISATKTEHRLGDVPVSMDVITAEDMLLKGAKTVHDALRGIPGISIGKNSGSWGDKGEVSLQGLDAAYTLVLVDGQKMIGGHGGSFDLTNIPVEIVERIEVVKGAASALYGSDALGGVVNIITKAPPEKATASISATLGSRNTQIYEAFAGATIEGVGIQANYTHRESDGVNKETDEYVEDMVQAAFAYKFLPDMKLTLKPNYTKTRIVPDERDQEYVGGNLLYDWKPTRDSKVVFRGSMLRYIHKTDSESTDYNATETEAELMYSRRLFSNYTLTGGYVYNTRTNDDRAKGYTADQTLNSGYLQAEAKVRMVTLVAGVRVDSHDLWGTETNPKGSVMVDIIDGLKARASVGTSFKAPSLVELYADDWRMGPFSVQANPELKPEKALSYQAGLEYVLGKYLLTKASYFRNDMEDMIGYTTTRMGPPPWDMNWINIDEAMTQGVEASLKSQLFDGLDINLGYTYLLTENKETGMALTYKPKHKLEAEIAYLIPYIDLRVALEAEYVGERFEDDENEDKLGEYTLYHLTLSHDVAGKGNAFVRVENLSNENDIEDEYDVDGAYITVGYKMKY